MSDYVFVSCDGEQIPVIIETRRGVRNITLRPKTRPAREIHMSKPWSARDAAALRFLESKRRWVERIYATTPAKSELAPGDVIDLLGRRVELGHDSTARGNKFVVCDNGMCKLIVGGGADMFQRRVRDYVRAEFLSAVKQMIRSAPCEFWPRRVAVRDTSTRWGSCSTSGTMSFSWRLAFAPTEVMRYVVMHELAHTKHMDHSPEFWATVSELYGFGVERAKRWLNVHGAELHRYL